MVINLLREAKTRLGKAGRFELPARTERCVLVYYDGSPASMAALRGACAHSTPNTRIVVVYLEQVSPEQKTDERADKDFVGNAVLAAAIVNAQTYGFKVETLCLETAARGITLEQLIARYSNSMLYLGRDPQNPDWLTDYMQAHARGQIVVVPVNFDKESWD